MSLAARRTLAYRRSGVAWLTAVKNGILVMRDKIAILVRSS